MRRDERCKIGSRVKGVVNDSGVVIGTIVQPAQRKLETIASTAALQSQVCEVPDLLARVAICIPVNIAMKEIASRQCVRFMKLRQVISEKEGAGYGDVHHFVRVDS